MLHHKHINKKSADGDLVGASTGPADKRWLTHHKISVSLEHALCRYICSTSESQLVTASGPDADAKE